MAYTELDPQRAAAAHVLRRATMAAHPDALEQVKDADAAVNWALDAKPNTDEPPRGEWQDTLKWWFDRMLSPDAGIHERMTWFWHTILTSSGDSARSDHQIGDQLQLLRTNALGNFRDLLQAFVVDGLLLGFLTANGSIASNPNENLARELMELFTLGPGEPSQPNYSQDDVRGAARALAGWVIREDPNEEGHAVVQFDRSNSFVAPLIFMGEQRNWDTASIVDRLCDHPATAQRIASILWTDLVGSPPPDPVELGMWWQDNDLEIRPLVGRVLSSSEFLIARLNRPRSGLEWWLAAHSGLDLAPSDYWALQGLEQVPYYPPNVGGWPRDTRWLSVGSLSERSQLTWSLIGEERPPAHDTTRDITERLGLFTLSDSTLAALEQVDRAAGQLDPETAQLVRWRSTLCTPEFNLA